jgi:hypothetical protein
LQKKLWLKKWKGRLRRDVAEVDMQPASQLRRLRQWKLLLKKLKLLQLKFGPSHELVSNTVH